MQATADSGRGPGVLPSRQCRDASTLRARCRCEQAGRPGRLCRDHHRCCPRRDDTDVADRDASRREGGVLAGASDFLHRAADPRRHRRPCDEQVGCISGSDPGRGRSWAPERRRSRSCRTHPRRHGTGQCRTGRRHDRARSRRLAQPRDRRMDCPGNRLQRDVPHSRRFCARVDRVVARFRFGTSPRLRAAPSSLRDGARKLADRWSALMYSANAATWVIAGLATFGVIARPWNLPEFIWAVAGAALLVVLGLLAWPDALAAASKGLDVYFFLVGMMLLAEVAQVEGLFDWLATQAVTHARGSSKRLFLIVYLVGTIVTVLLSNDATAVVLTPAVYAATRAAKVEPLPYLFICAFIANAASFVLPISNPANLVVFGKQMPPLADWLRIFALPSVVAIVATYLALWLTQRRALDTEVAE